MKAILALEDGSVYHGEGFGSPASACGEVCFNTSMTGYQEILTDPSYKGQIVTMTYPLIGNYGVNRVDVESWRPHVAGFVIRELSPVVSNWRADRTLAEYLEENGIPGIQGVDTRALTRKLRVRGAMNGFISTEGLSAEEAVARAKAWPGLVGVDYVKEVTHREPFLWDANDEQSSEFRLVRGAIVEDGSTSNALPPADIPIVAYDFGMKYNILRRLRQHGFRVQVVPATTPAAEALKYKPAGIFLSNGPGDPEPCDYAIAAAAALIDTGIPTFGICLGHQIMALASGAKTFKMQHSHHGANHPVKDLDNGRVSITSQNHGFAVALDSLPANLRATHISLFDNTLQGLARTDKPAFCFQGHPEASPGPHDISYLFDRFTALMEQHRAAR